MGEPVDADTQARLRRLDALRGLAQQTEQPTSATGAASASGAADAPAASTTAQPAAMQRAGMGMGGRRGLAAQVMAAPRWRAVALGALVVLVALSVALGALLRAGGGAGPLRLGAKPAPALTAKLLTTTAFKPLYCLSAPAWSPNGASLAVFGQTNPPTDSCQPYNMQTGIEQLSEGASASQPYQSANQAIGLELDIIDTATGHVRQQIALPSLFQSFSFFRTNLSDNPICNDAPNCVLYGSGRGVGEPLLQPLLQSLSWTPDGTAVVISFNYQLLSDFNAPLSDPNATPAFIQSGAGLVIAPVGATAATPRMLLHTATQQPYVANTTPTPPNFIWDLSTGTATEVTLPATTALDTAAFAPAYRWTPNGQLVALASATATGKATQTPWRNGVIEPRQHASDPVLYQTSQWFWSPDGRYAAPDMNTSAYVRLPGVAEAATPAGSAATPPLVNPPWLALDDAVTSAINSPVGLEVAQSPDGALLASFSCKPDFTGALTIRSTAHAAPLVQTSFTFPYAPNSQGCQSDIGTLVWSPDGKHLAASMEQIAQIVVWQVNVQE